MASIHNPIGKYGPSLCRVLLLIVGSLLVGPPGMKAQSTVRPLSGLQPVLPLVEETLPRPLEGSAADQQFRARRQEPLGSFMDTLKGNDAALQIVVGQGRLLTIKQDQDIAAPEGSAVVAVGDPTILEFELLPNPRLIRLTGIRAGVTDLSITTPSGSTYSFEVHVNYDLPLLSAHLRQIFPDALIRLSQLREHLVVEGQARSAGQVARILETVQSYLISVQVSTEIEGDQVPRGTNPPPARGRGRDEPGNPAEEPAPVAGEETGGPKRIRATFPQPRVINLLVVPGVQQVLLKVRIAELNRTGLREIGADILGVDPDTGNILGTSIGGATVAALGLLDGAGLVGTASGSNGTNTTAFGIFPSGDFEILLRALRRNSLLTILAEPNLIALSGHHANFLAGGEFPVPVPQGGGGTFANFTIQFREFGVKLDFLPFVLDEESVRLTVTPEVSSIDPALGTTLVPGGNPVPGLNTRRAQTTVELNQGQTLAIAGLLQVELEGRTNRIPGLGDLPYLGPLFSNTSHRRVEKELLVLVTPYLVQPLQPHEVMPLPVDGINDPTDCEFYLRNQIEGRTACPVRSTTDYEHPRRLLLSDYDRQYMHGPVGLSTGVLPQGQVRPAAAQSLLK